MEKESFKEKLSKLTDLLEDKLKPSVSKFEEVVLADETKINIEPAVEVGATVSIEVEGEMQPVPNETYELADGRKIVVENGAISEVIEAEEEQEETTEEMNDDNLTVEDVQKMLDALGFKHQEEIKELKESFNTQLSELKLEFKTDSDNVKKAVLEGFKELGELPSEVTEKKKNGFNYDAPKKASKLKYDI